MYRTGISIYRTMIKIIVAATIGSFFGSTFFPLIKEYFKRLGKLSIAYNKCIGRYGIYNGKFEKSLEIDSEYAIGEFRGYVHFDKLVDNLGIINLYARDMSENTELSKDKNERKEKVKNFKKITPFGLMCMQLCYYF